MGHPQYEITEGSLSLDGEDISQASPDERNQKGIFLAFQHIPEIPGVKLFEFLKAIYDAKQTSPTTFLSFKALIEPLLVELGLPKEFLWRDLNVGFSGGERRKVEILQIKLLRPQYIILDEIDSGLDVDALKQVFQHLVHLDSPTQTLILITHRFSLAESIRTDEVLILKQGHLVQRGDASLIEQVKQQGFA